MAQPTLVWSHQPQETTGTYMFSGRFVATHGIANLLSDTEIFALYWLIRALAEQEKGLDYLQVFVHQESGRKLFLIDQINEVMKKEHPPEHDHCTLMLAEEY
jgi:hypothetical protein